ncbi:alpha/beta hydrolase family protein [Stieleria marina]
MNLIKRLLFVLLTCLFVSAGSLAAQDAVPADDLWYTKKTDWHGHDQLHFRHADADCYLIKPTKALPGNPWIWRVRFPGFHAEMDVELVGQGFHLAYMDVANQFGCPNVIKRAETFYDRLVSEHDLNRKVVLEGVSRGGLFVYNYAAMHPDHVAAIYCDTPVLDFNSWPRGKGPVGKYTGVGHSASWQQCLKVYGLTDAQAATYDKLPIHHAAIIAKANIPVMHIVSENDRVVPPIENTYVLRDRLKDLGHEMKLIVVPEGTEKSNGHHFTHPEPNTVIQFITTHGQPSPK